MYRARLIPWGMEKHYERVSHKINTEIFDVLDMDDWWYFSMADLADWGFRFKDFLVADCLVFLQVAFYDEFDACPSCEQGFFYLDVFETDGSFQEKFCCDTCGMTSPWMNYVHRWRWSKTPTPY